MSSSGTKVGNVISMFLYYAACKCHVDLRNISANLPFLIIFPPLSCVSVASIKPQIQYINS